MRTVVKITPAAGTCTCTQTQVIIFFAFCLTQVSQTHSGCCCHSSQSKHQLADNSHGCNIFALMLVRDARDVCSEGPLSSLYIMWPQNSCEVFRFSEALKEDGCSLGCFSHLAQTVRLSLEHPQERISLLCQLFKRPHASNCSAL